jgi:hypothetical protein
MRVCRDRVGLGEEEERRLDARADLVALIVVVVLFWWSPTPATGYPVTATVLVALLVLGIEGLRRKTVREFPDADRAAAAQWRRERFARVSAGAAEKARAGSGAVARKASQITATAPQEDARAEPRCTAVQRASRGSGCTQACRTVRPQ